MGSCLEDVAEDVRAAAVFPASSDVAAEAAGERDAVTRIFLVGNAGSGGQHNSITRGIGHSTHGFEHARQIIGNFCAA